MAHPDWLHRWGPRSLFHAGTSGARILPTPSERMGLSWRDWYEQKQRAHRLDDAAHALYRQYPELSARSGLTHSQARTVLAFTVCMALGFALAPIGWLIGLAGFAGGLVLILSGLRLAAALTAPVLAPRQTLPDAALPVVSVLVALYKESAILPHLVEALRALNYPADRLDIKLVIEADDRETLSCAHALGLERHFQIVEVPPGSPRTKPKALNYALHQARGRLLALYDAEDRPHPDQIRQAAESFAAAGPDVACLQAPLNWYNARHNRLTRQFALEYAAHFLTLLPFYQRMGWPLPLGGTSNIFLTRTLREVGGWDPYNVTEDADLGLRLARHGYTTGLVAPPTLEEAPTRVGHWTAQRSRWIKGYAQTLLVHLRQPARLLKRDPALLTGLIVTLGLPVLSALLHGPALVGGLIWFILPFAPWTTKALILGLALAGYTGALSILVCGARRAGLDLRVSDLMLSPLYWSLQTPAAVRALWELVWRPYYWSKTSHGHSLDVSDHPGTSPPCISTSQRRSLASRLPRRSLPSRPGVPVGRTTRSRVKARSPGR